MPSRTEGELLMRRLVMMFAVVALLLIAFVPAPAGAAKCVEIQGIGDPCAAACQAINKAAGKFVTCQLA